MHMKIRKVSIAYIVFGAIHIGFAADMNIQLATNDGSTKLSLQNAAASEVASVDSQGNATFTKVTQSGSGGSFIVNQNTLQSGATFFVSSGTVTGTLSAGTFSGSGAGLTNFPAAGLTGTIADSAIDASSVTKQGNTFNGANQLVQLNGSGNLTALNAANLTSLSAGNLTGIVPNATIDSSSITKQGNTFNAASQLVKLDGSGNMSLPSGASITVGTVRGTVVPSGTLILTTATCPSGYTEYTAAGGFYLVGVPSGGTVGGTMGSAMTNLANDTHNHTVSTTSANFVTIAGNTPAVTSVTSPTGNVARATIAPYFQIRLCSVP
jgi:hypothetical protein